MKVQQIKILGSGSKGNSLVIYDSRGKYIILDVGLTYKEILRGLDYNLNNCVSIICSHNHLADHTKSLDYFIKLGVPCYGNQDICDSHKGCNLLPKVLNIDGFRIQNFELVHNVPNNAIIVDTLCGIRLLYCTDTEYIPKKVKGVNYAIIECNHDDDFMVDNAMEDVLSMSHHENHQSLDRCIEYLKVIFSPSLQGVILWHLSDTNINESKALKKVKKELGFDNIVCAKENLIIPLQKEEF
jgi:phosphoribosyl 1,2-cyclic phosphodiesterase